MDDCYKLNNLEKFKNQAFIYERKSINTENIYSYKVIIKETYKFLDFLQSHHIDNNAGIAIALKEHSAAACILVLGILNHKCSFFYLDFEETKDVAIYLKSSGVKYIITPQNFQFDNELKLINNEIQILKEVFQLYFYKSNGSFDNFTKCFTISTSGSTGPPKIVHVPYKCIEPNIKSLSHLLNIGKNDMIFLSSPPTFDPFVVEFFLALENGASILITSMQMRLQPQLLLQIMFPDIKTSKRGVTLYQTTPSLFRLFGKEDIQNIILNINSTLRYLILGGEDFPSDLEFKSWLPLDFPATSKRIFNIYGITEISCWSSIYEFDAKAKTDNMLHMPLGKPLDNFTFFRLADEYGNVLDSNDCIGELEIGSSVRYCYIQQYDGDVNNLNGNDIIYRKTGDLVKRDRSGNIYYIGRTNNTIKRFGKRLCLDALNKKVENVLTTNNIHFKVISLWDTKTLSLIFCFVCSKEMLPNDKEFIVSMLREKLESHEQPDKIFYNEMLQVNRHGKVDRNKILQQILSSTKSPVEIFKDFLTNVMGFELDIAKNESNFATRKRVKLSTSLSFTKAGGTSFQALSIATEIGEVMDDRNEQRKILEMLLDNNMTIECVLTFLTSCSKKSKLKDISNKPSENINTTIKLKLLWRRDLKKCIDAAPSIYEEKFVLVGSHSHLLMTVNATTGEKISCLKLNDRIECPVLIISSHLAVVGCYDGFAYGFDFNSGSVLWKFNAKGMIKAKPLKNKNMIIIASYAQDYNIVAFDIKTSHLIWRLQLGSKGIFSSPVKITEESILFCNLDGTYALIKADTGAINWSKKLDTPIFSTASKIQTSNEILFALAEVKGRISICKAANGEIMTSYQTEGNIFSGLTLHQPDHENYSLLIFGCHDNNVYCLKLAHTTKELYLLSKHCLNTAVYSTPIVILKRYILACTTRGLITLIDIEKNIILASFDLKADVFSSPSCLSDKYIYVGSRDNYLYCFQIEK